MLPLPNQENEFIDTLQQSLQNQSCSQEQLKGLISAAIEARRPQLAGKLFQLLDDTHTQDPNLLKAQKALAFLLIEENQHSDTHWEDVQSSWAAFVPSKAGQRLRDRHHPSSKLSDSNWMGAQLPPHRSRNPWRRR